MLAGEQQQIVWTCMTGFAGPHPHRLTPPALAPRPLSCSNTETLRGRLEAHLAGKSMAPPTPEPHPPPASPPPSLPAPIFKPWPTLLLHYYNHGNINHSPEL